ncbi:TRAP transporter large permease subunit [Paracoccus aurantiacus]|uniref:TRAP transporter large permease subunit n=1 Tax=Paracoccus aurantiacus TaxID=2599412 RepID=A0A5C6S9C0_9RHOB|nr:TRAP transporter large permease subunit [Paracoccus aurantiacus]TXB70712.1 TRAP transporter large permease subunit [Paracoccus aurantiacus]
MMELIAQNMAPIMFASLILFLLFGYPVAFALAANGLLFFVIGVELAPLSDSIYLDWNLLGTMPDRLWGVMSNETLLAIPFFTFMGILLEKSGMAEDLLDTIGQLFGPVRGGLAYAVVIVGALLAATTGVVAASVIAMGLISLPIMLRYGYDRRLASGVIAASGTLAQIIPPSLVLIVMADQLGRSVGDMYKGALIPGLVLTCIYLGYIFVMSIIRPNAVPALPKEARTLGSGVISLLVLILVGVGIFYGAHHYLSASQGNNADILGAAVGVAAMYLIAMTDREGWRFIVKVAAGAIGALAGWYFLHTIDSLPWLDTVDTNMRVGVLIVTVFASAILAFAVYSLLIRLLGGVIDFTHRDEHAFGMTSRLAQQVVIVLVPPLALVFFVLGTIFLGWATPTEGGAMGAVGALVLSAMKGRLSLDVIRQALASTTRLSAFVMFILIGARVFSLTFYGVNGHLWVEHLLTSLPGGEYGFLIVVSVMVFFLAFFLDFFELAFIIVPLLVPAAEALGIDLIWFGVILAVNMQTSFMHPPFGFALFYLRSVAPRASYQDRVTGRTIEGIRSSQIYWGAVPFVFIQIAMIGVVILFPGLVMHYKGAPVDMQDVQINIPMGGNDGGFGSLGGLGSPFGAPGGAPATGTDAAPGGTTAPNGGGMDPLGGLPPGLSAPGATTAPAPQAPGAADAPAAGAPAAEAPAPAASDAPASSGGMSGDTDPLSGPPPGLAAPSN